MLFPIGLPPQRVQRPGSPRGALLLRRRTLPGRRGLRGRPVSRPGLPRRPQLSPGTQPGPRAEPVSRQERAAAARLHLLAAQASWLRPRAPAFPAAQSEPWRGPLRPRGAEPCGRFCFPRRFEMIIFVLIFKLSYFMVFIKNANFLILSTCPLIRHLNPGG